VLPVSAIIEVDVRGPSSELLIAAFSTMRLGLSISGGNDSGRGSCLS
jgi:hypothetical protein